MRINIYSQELTEEVQEIYKTSDTGVVYSGVRLVLHSSERLHHDVDRDDDRSGVTIWLPRTFERREALAQTLERMAKFVRNAPPNNGLD